MNIKDYIYLYMGCRLVYFNSKGEPTTLQELAPDNFLFYSHWLDRSKLALRRLSDMTEKESAELLHVQLAADYPDSEQGWLMNEAVRVKFLLSKHFDLFGLIDAGLAIDKATLDNGTAQIDPIAYTKGDMLGLMGYYHDLSVTNKLHGKLREEILRDFLNNQKGE